MSGEVKQKRERPLVDDAFYDRDEAAFWLGRSKEAIRMMERNQKISRAKLASDERRVFYQGSELRRVMGHS
jgi:hypothetical protein